MPHGKSAKATIDYLEQLEQNTEIIPIDLSVPSSRRILGQYMTKKKKVKDLSFNDFLSQHEDFKSKCKGKVVVAEITGGKDGVVLGYRANETYGESFKYSEDEVSIDGGDFTGCRFSKVELHEMKNVSLRDALFDQVSVIGGRLSNVDFRGSDFSKCEFIDYSRESALRGVQLGLASPDKVQDKGVFELVDNANLDHAKMNIDTKLEKQQLTDIQAEIQKYVDENWKYYAVVGAYKPSRWNITYTKKDLPVDLQERISKIEEKYKGIREEEIAKSSKKCATRFVDPILDPTYTPNQSAERASAVKVSLKATKADLQEYIASKPTISFNDFIAKKNATEIQAQKEANPGKMVVAVADLSKQDISGMDLSKLDLSGVNLAYANMQNCVLNEANLQGSCLEGADLTEAKLREATLMDANMIGSTVSRADFEKANMIRVRGHAADFKEANMNAVVGYRSIFTGANMESAKLRGADMRKSDLERVNLRYVDAQYAKLQGAKLSHAVAYRANLAHADLSDTVAEHFSAQEAKLESAVMDGMRAAHADFKKSSLDKVSAKGADFSYADLKEIKAKHANFEKSVLDRVDAKLADFESAILTDEKAREADLKDATLKDIEGERIDISGAVIEKADFEGAKMREAVMEDVQARGASFKKAFLEKAKLAKGSFVGTNFQGANLSSTDAKSAAFLGADFEGANVSHMETDPSTILLDANLTGIIGDKETVAGLRAQKEEQQALEKQWFGRSRYGVPKVGEREDRFKCQRLGAAVLSAAIGGGTGTVLAGPLAGVSAATLSVLVSDKVLTATKDQYFGDLGYVNNALGDRLAEVGAIAMSMGVGAADRAIDGAAAGLVCSFAGVAQGAALTAVGVGTTLGGAKLAISGVKKQSRWRKITGAVLGGVGAVATFFGASSMGASLSTVAYGAAAGAAIGGAWAGVDTAKRLYEYDDKKYTDKNPVGARPEHIYQESITRAKGIWRKIMPTMRKVVIGLALATIAVGLTAAAIYAAPAIPFIAGGALAVKATLATAGMTAAAGGFIGGYLYDDKIVSILPKRFRGDKKVEKKQEIQQSVGQGKDRKKDVEHGMEVSTKKKDTLEVSVRASASSVVAPSSSKVQKKVEGKFAKKEKARRATSGDKRKSI
ncbi:MAG: pentapeptide repeat-containing protein [Rickettsiales bacterium]|nr:pentapeptide repeat-containing protein [Rickettsiales bacterium]